nr:hypothetical protein [uncultured Mucilaginibacter sp.]
MKKIKLLLLAAFSFTSACAQKLPGVQQVSLRAPSTVRIDGKATEWGDKFQAYNPATELFYTIANDSKKLYLIAQTDNQKVFNNIISGGLRINIQKAGNKADAGAWAVKFPYLEKGKILLFTLHKKGEIPPPKELADHIADSIMIVNNKKLAANIKWIYTNGITGVDSLLSIYNDKGIEGAAAFDAKKTYTYELAIDLKLLGLSAENASKFAYHIMVNAEPNKFSMSQFFGPVTGGTNGDGSPMSQAQMDAVAQSIQKTANDISASTDFWGEYTLAK